jgi:hypothetical protein
VVVGLRVAPDRNPVPAARGHTSYEVEHGEGLAVRFVVAFPLTDGEARLQARNERAR